MGFSCPTGAGQRAGRLKTPIATAEKMPRELGELCARLFKGRSAPESALDEAQAQQSSPPHSCLSGPSGQEASLSSLNSGPSSPSGIVCHSASFPSGLKPGPGHKGRNGTIFNKCGQNYKQKEKQVCADTEGLLTLLLPPQASSPSGTAPIPPPCVPPPTGTPSCLT